MNKSGVKDPSINTSQDSSVGRHETIKIRSEQGSPRSQVQSLSEVIFLLNLFCSNTILVELPELCILRKTRLFTFQAGARFRRYWSIMFYIISIILNIMSFFVMTMKHNRHLSTCVYMSIIAVNDNLALTSNLNVWLVQNTPFSVYGDSYCKILIYLVQVFGGFGAYEIVLMTLDKVIAIKLPHKSALLRTSKRAIIFSVINFFTITIFYLPNADFSKQVGPSRCARYVKQGWYVTVPFTHCQSYYTSNNAVCYEYYHN